MHEAAKKAIGVAIANCSTCAHLGGDGDGWEYNGSWPVCNKHKSYGYLKSFPFKKEMKCWRPEFWASKFAKEISDGGEVEVDEKYELFRAALAEFEEVGRG